MCRPPGPLAPRHLSASGDPSVHPGRPRQAISGDSQRLAEQTARVGGPGGVLECALMSKIVPLGWNDLDLMGAGGPAVRPSRGQAAAPHFCGASPRPYSAGASTQRSIARSYFRAGLRSSRKIFRNRCARRKRRSAARCVRWRIWNVTPFARRSRRRATRSAKARRFWASAGKPSSTSAKSTD